MEVNFDMVDSKSKKSQSLTIDQALCIQCGTCVASYPDLFEFSDDGTKVHVKKKADFSGKNLKEIKETCPSEAIVNVSDTKTDSKKKPEKKKK